MELQWMDTGGSGEVGVLTESFSIKSGFWEEDCSHVWTIMPDQSGASYTTVAMGSVCVPDYSGTAQAALKIR